MEDGVRICPECGQELEEIVRTGSFGRPLWRWVCTCCGCEYDEDGNLVDTSVQFDDDYELANRSRGYDLDED